MAIAFTPQKLASAQSVSPRELVVNVYHHTTVHALRRLEWLKDTLLKTGREHQSTQD